MAETAARGGRAARVAVVGSANTDTVVWAGRLPGPGERVGGASFAMAAEQRVLR